MVFEDLHPRIAARHDVADQTWLLVSSLSWHAIRRFRNRAEVDRLDFRDDLGVDL